MNKFLNLSKRKKNTANLESIKKYYHDNFYFNLDSIESDIIEILFWLSKLLTYSKSIEINSNRLVDLFFDYIFSKYCVINKKEKIKEHIKLWLVSKEGMELMKEYNFIPVYSEDALIEFKLEDK